MLRVLFVLAMLSLVASQSKLPERFVNHQASSTSRGNQREQDQLLMQEYMHRAKELNELSKEIERLKTDNNHDGVLHLQQVRTELLKSQDDLMKRRNNLASTGQASLSHVDHLTSNIIPATEKKSEESVSADVLKMLNMREQLSELQQQPINDARIAEIKAAVEEYRKFDEAHPGLSAQADLFFAKKQAERINALEEYSAQNHKARESPLAPLDATSDSKAYANGRATNSRPGFKASATGMGGGSRTMSTTEASSNPRSQKQSSPKTNPNDRNQVDRVKKSSTDSLGTTSSNGVDLFVESRKLQARLEADQYFVQLREFKVEAEQVSFYSQKIMDLLDLELHVIKADQDIYALLSTPLQSSPPSAPAPNSPTLDDSSSIKPPPAQDLLSGSEDAAAARERQASVALLRAQRSQDLKEIDSLKDYLRASFEMERRRMDRQNQILNK